MNDQIRELNKPPIRLIERILEKFVTAILETVRDECIEANNRISALEAELAEWRKDAERYRWLRDKCRDGSLTIARADDWSLHPWSGDDIDKEIDAAHKGEETT